MLEGSQGKLQDRSNEQKKGIFDIYDMFGGRFQLCKQKFSTGDK